MSSADCNTDHKLCRTKFRLNIKLAVRKRGVQVKKLDTNRHLARKSEFEEELQARQEKEELLRNRSKAPLVAAENHSPESCGESRRPLHEEAQRLV